MAQFNCEVKRTDDVKVELDDKVLDEDWMEHFRQFFYDFYTLEDHAEHIAQHYARFGYGFIEGYGYPKENGSIPGYVDENRVNTAINIIPVFDDVEVDVTEEE